jgi:DNA polymerase-3 subunit gamma/tau
MSYLVLARKYRPRTFSQMVGQGHVVQALTNALQTQRLHHAYLFTGTRGVGKTTVSRILAKSLNCVGPDGQGGITAEPCGVCQACTDIDAGRFIDYTELDAASNRGVDEVQSLLEQAAYKPVQGRFKVFMIDEVHMLSNTAFNAMLKTLEEPPEYLKFVLATTDPQKVPVTVLSRCLQFNLRPMAPQTVLDHLVQVLQAEGVAADLPALRLLARAARGSMRDALSLTDQAIAFGSGAIEEAGVRQMLGAVDRTYVWRLIEALAVGDGKTVVETCEELRLHGLSAASTLEEMATVLQRMAVLRVAAGSVDENDPEEAQCQRLAALMPADENQLLYSICLHGRSDLGLAPDEYAALTMVLLRLLAFKPQTFVQGSAVEPAKKPEAATGAARPAPAGNMPARAAVTTRPAAAPVPSVAPAPVLAATPPEPRAPAAVAVQAPADEALPEVSDEPPAESAPAVTPSPLLAVPVRMVPEPSARTEQRVERAGPDSFTPTESGEFWHGVVQALVAAEAIGALVRELALQSQLMAQFEGTWTLRVERESLTQGTNRDKLQAALQGAGHVVQLVIELGPVQDSPARRLAAAQAARQRQAEEIIHNDPFVQSMMRDYGGRIVPGSIRPI